MALRSPLTVQPYDYIGDSTGRPLDKGQIYIGVAGQDPEFYQIPVFLDAEMTKPIDQPIRTNDGFVDFAGSLSELYASAEIYSVKVLDKQGRKVIYKAEMMRDNLTDDALQSLNTAIAESQAQAVITTAELVNESIDDIMLGEYRTQLEVKVDTLSDDVSNLSADVSAQKLDTGITATAKFGGVERTQAEKNSDVLSLNDFIPDGSHTAHTQYFLNAIAAAKSLKKDLSVPTGTYFLKARIDITGVTIRCASDVVFDFSENTGTYCFDTSGILGTAINVTSVSSDYLTLVCETTPNYVSGDMLLLTSSTRCDLESEAGSMTLGVGTSGAGATYFAEPVEVLSVSGNTITLGYKTTFNKYSKAVSGFVGKVEKMNFVNTNIYGYPKIKLREGGYTVGVFSRYSKDAVFEVNGAATLATSSLVYLSRCYKSLVKGTCVRPNNWTLAADHSLYNSWKSLSGWYNKFNVVEHYGSQSVDQSYNGICSIGEEYIVHSFNPREQGFTSHGMSYGTKADITVYNCGTTAVASRARFAEIKVTGYNNLITGAGVTGLKLYDYGMTDVKAEVNLVGFNTTVLLGKSFLSVANTPALVQCTIKGTAVNTETVLELNNKVPTDLDYNSFIKLNMNVANCRRVVKTNETGWHGVDVQGIYSIDSTYLSTDTLVDNSKTSYGWSASNLTIRGYSSNKTVFSVNNVEDYTLPKALNISWGTCTFKGTGQVQRGYNYLTAIIDPEQLLTSRNERVWVDDTFLYASSASNTLTVSSASKIPIGKPLTFYCSSNSFQLDGEGVTIQGSQSFLYKVMTILRVGSVTYHVSGY